MLITSYKHNRLEPFLQGLNAKKLIRFRLVLWGAKARVYEEFVSHVFHLARS